MVSELERDHAVRRERFPDFGPHTLYMKYPASWWHDLWREGLVSGNGFIGACVYGGVKYETVMLSHHKLWHHGSAAELPDVSDAFQRQRALMNEGRFPEASWEIVNALRNQGYHAELESPFPAGDLQIEITPKSGFRDYVRGVNMDTGEVFSRWVDGSDFRSGSLFVSRADHMVIKRLQSDEGMQISVKLGVHRNTGSGGLEQYGKHILESMALEVSTPFMVYTALDDKGKVFGAAAKVLSASSAVTGSGDALIVGNSTDTLILLKVFADVDPRDREAAIRRALTDLDRSDDSYDRLLARHEALHRPLYESAGFSLDAGDTCHSNEELLLEAYGGHQSAEMIQKLWRFGRYLFISGTDENGDPFPLYGLWAGDYRLQWAHNMANENIQMIYWHTFTGNLPAFHKAFIRYFTDRIPAFRQNAEKLFGLKGLYMTAGTTPGVSVPTQVVPVIINWVSAGAWIAQHYVRYDLYMQDRTFFEESILPFLSEIAAFYEDFVTFDEHGGIRFFPSVSPENTPGNFMPPKHIQIPHPMPTTVNSTIDLAILKEFLTSMCLIAQKYPELQSRAEQWKRILSAVPPYRVNTDGAIREWQDERFTERYDHRHLSHIYPVFPGEEVNALCHSELLPAFEKAVSMRKIDAQTGWSMAHMAAIYARFGKGGAAMECLDRMAQSCLTNSFLSLHNDWRGMNISLNMDPAPVQLDAIMGYVNAVQEMLLYASDGLISLLPAVPEAMNAGSVQNFRYAHGYVDMKWNIADRFFEADIRSIRPHEIRVKVPEFAGECSIQACGAVFTREDKLLTLKADENGTVRIVSTDRGKKREDAPVMPD